MRSPWVLSIASIALAAWAAVGAASLAAQEPAAARSAIVTRTTDPIAIDGALDEPIWTSAPKIGNLIQRQPLPGEAPTEGTEVTLLRDDDNLYIGVRALDSEADSVIGTQMARDASLNADDRIELLLDTFRDRRSAFYFATNPAGALVDGLAFANGQLNLEWDAIWRVRTSRGREGWSAEFAIPFKSLSFPSGRDEWGFNVSRTIYRKLEDNRWSGAQLQTQFLQVSEAGQITNLGRLTQGIGLDLRPFFAGSWLNLRAGSDEWKRKPGLDLFYSITPSLKLTTTFNTDFGETEVDARQINLTRFSLLFPEKRAFFLEGAGVFSFASTGPETPGGIPATGADVFPFFSRQIGLLAGQEVPIDAGVKLIGTAGRTEIGMLDVRTGDLRVGNTLVTDEKNFFVGRVKRNLFRQSYVGAIFTEGNPVQGEAGRTFGADLRLATSRFLGGQRNLNLNAYAVRSQNEARSGNDWSYGFSAHYPNDKYLAQFALREIQENFQPGLGFVQRNNVRMIRAAGSFNPRPRDFLNIQQMNHDVFFTQFTRLDLNEIESWDVYVTWLDWHFNSGDNVHGILDFNPTYERLFERFEISPGVILTPGEYRFTRFRSNLFSSASKRRLSGSANIAWGNYWSGEAEQFTASVTYKAPPRFIISVNSNQTFARLPEGNFTAKIFTSNINYSASPSLSFSNLIQFDNRSRNLGWQSRVRWTLQPGNDLFVAFNQGWIQDYSDEGNRRFQIQDTKLSAKFQYLSLLTPFHPASTGSRSVWGLAYLALSAILVSAVWPHLKNFPPVSADEVWIMSASFKLAGEGTFGSDLYVGFYGADRHYFLNLPVHHVVQAAFFKAVGAGIVQARAPSLIAAVVVLGAVGWLSFRWGGLGCSVAAGVLLMFWRSNIIAADPRPPLLALAQSGRYDAIVIGFWWSTVLLFNRHWQAPRPTTAVAVGLLAGTTALTQFYGAGILICCGAALLVARGRNDQPPRLYAREIAIGALTPILIYATYVVSHWTDFVQQTTFRLDRLRFYDIRFYAANLFNEWHRVEWLFQPSTDIIGSWTVMAAIPLTFFAFARLFRVDAWGPMTALAAWLSLALLDSIKARIYASLLVPLFSFGLAAALVPNRLLMSRGRLAAIRTLAGGAFLVWIVSDGYAGYRFVATEGPRVSRYDDVGRQIAGSLEPGRSVLGSQRWWWALRTHPYRSLSAQWQIWEVEERAKHEPDFNDMLARSQDVYLIFDNDIRGDLSRAPARLRQQVSDLLTSRARMVASWRDPTYGLIEIYRL